VDRGPGPGRRARFYALHLQPALWGAVDVVRAPGAGSATATGHGAWSPATPMRAAPV
jgi:hypothetical protein